MLFEGEELHRMIDRTPNPIEFHNEYGRCCRVYPREAALKLDCDLFIGVGNLRRIKFLRFRNPTYAVNAGSQTTMRLKGEDGANISQPCIREHRPVRDAANGRLSRSTQTDEKVK